MTTDNIDISNITFSDDKLGRLEFAKNLVRIIEKEDNGYVLAIDSAWGGGKTHFCHMFKNALNDGYKEDIIKGNKCLYFDAWENDFSEEPLVNFIGEILKDENNIKEDTKENLKTSTVNFVKAALPIAIKGGASYWLGRILGKETLEELKDGISELSGNLIENVLVEDINKYQEIKATIKIFKDSLKKIAPEGKKLVIFIDELDRCRPDYAIKLLEHIKYIFRTENVFFILSINRYELANSIQSVYGNIDAKAYLKRFVDYVVALPEPNHEEYIRVLFNKTLKDKIKNLHTTNDAVIAFSAISRLCDFTIRDIEQTFEELEFIFQSFGDTIFEKSLLGYLSMFLVMKNQTKYPKYNVFEMGISKNSLIWENLDISTEIRMGKFKLFNETIIKAKITLRIFQGDYNNALDKIHFIDNHIQHLRKRLNEAGFSDSNINNFRDLLFSKAQKTILEYMTNKVQLLKMQK